MLCMGKQVLVILLFARYVLGDIQMALIQIEKASRYYQLGETQVAALKDIDLVIEKGEFVAIWGPSGSGKSTLCNLIGAIDHPSSGRVFVGGKDVGELSDDDLSAHRNHSVGFIFQGFNLIAVLTALENVMLPLTLRGESDAAARDKAKDILEKMGLVEFIGQRPDKLSGGQRQRVAIARALVAETPLVIADEPTANLDSENADKIVGLMKQFNESTGTTFVFSTHDERLLGEVNRRIHLRDGVILEDSTD